MDATAGFSPVPILSDGRPLNNTPKKQYKKSIDPSLPLEDAEVGSGPIVGSEANDRTPVPVRQRRDELGK